MADLASKRLLLYIRNELSYPYLENDHTHSANQRREFSCSIFHKLSGITSISMLYIEHTNEISKQRKTLCFPLFLNLISMLYMEHTNDA